jgi:uncharacterized OsmC-like protein
MPSSTIIYEGNTRCSLKYDATGATISTIGPVELGGDGSTFSPTDLVAAALGACMLEWIPILFRY